MKDRLTAEDVQSDIEFELAQGVISHGDLAQAIHAVKRYQNQVRGEMVWDSRRIQNVDRVINRLFQINDMLITLLHEAALAIQSLRIDLRRVTQIRGSAIPTSPPGSASAPVSRLDSVDDAPGYWLTGVRSEDESDRDRFAQLESAMHSESLRVPMGVRPVRVPVVGRPLQRLRAMFHNLVLFYVKRLAGRQTMVNQTFGDSIWHLIHANRRLRRQIAELSQQLATLQTRLEKAESDEDGVG